MTFDHPLPSAPLARQDSILARGLNSECVICLDRQVLSNIHVIQTMVLSIAMPFSCSYLYVYVPWYFINWRDLLTQYMYWYLYMFIWTPLYQPGLSFSLLWFSSPVDMFAAVKSVLLLSRTVPCVEEPLFSESNWTLLLGSQQNPLQVPPSQNRQSTPHLLLSIVSSITPSDFLYL